jgi:hypothetical protein
MLLGQNGTNSIRYLSGVRRLFALLADLIRDAAGGLACGLAGSLALAAAACFQGLCEIAGAERFDPFHG